MKKTLIYSSLVISIFLICLSLSIIVKHFFDVDGDYLSAFATLIAAAVAYYLYNDWKAPYQIEKIRDEQNEIRIMVRVVKKNIESLIFFAYTKVKDENQFNNSQDLILEFQVLARNILDSIDDLASLLASYKIIFESSNNELLNNHILIVDESYQACEKLHSEVNKYNSIDNHLQAFSYLRNNLTSKANEQSIRKLTETLPEGMAAFHRDLIKLKKENKSLF
ncbi:hypothetical protein [Acinetobacter baumannii]|uniref:hypothetical protein n=1 Tax=Acinetobacter baumannii TaxID=470 RepID=UPI003D166449